MCCRQGEHCVGPGQSMCLAWSVQKHTSCEEAKRREGQDTKMWQNSLCYVLQVTVTVTVTNFRQGGGAGKFE